MSNARLVSIVSRDIDAVSINKNTSGIRSRGARRACCVLEAWTGRYRLRLPWIRHHVTQRERKRQMHAYLYNAEKDIHSIVGTVHLV